MPTEEEDPNVIHADPSKDFFIDMLTRDISLSECILDLLDNSVHGVIRRDKLDVMTPLAKGRLPPKSVDAEVKIDFTPTQFSISDDSGGISIDEARDEVFLFGKANTDAARSGLGVYGIGMKRALFKLGKVINVQSHTTEEELSVSLNVDDWRKRKNDWTLSFDYARSKTRKVGGTTITVKSLNPVAKTQFASPTFESNLADRIAVTYGLFIKAGIKVKLNGTPVDADIPEFASSKDLGTARHQFEKDGVDILITVGASPLDDRTPRGWYVFCNGRCVLVADKTERTGWGDNNVPVFHPRYNHFLGFVYFRSKDVSKLPWTTTKEGVNRESPIYQAALAQMRTVARPAIEFYQRMYKDTPVEQSPEKKLLESAKATPIQKVTGKANTGFVATAKSEPEDEQVSIQYKKSKKEIDKAKKLIGKGRMSAGSVGEFTFDWYLRRNS